MLPVQAATLLVGLLYTATRFYSDWPLSRGTSISTLANYLVARTIEAAFVELDIL